MSRLEPRKVAMTLAAPVIAIVFAALVTALVLAATGDPVWSTVTTVWDYGSKPRVIALTLNQATTYYLSALAVAIGFRMNLFNIGVDGQYRLAAFAAAVVGTSVSLPKPLHLLVIVLTAMLVGAMWAGVAAVLKVSRGVSEVISTIMLNAIATSLIAFLLSKVATDVAGSNNRGTDPIPESGHFPGIPLIPGSPLDSFGFIIVAVLAGIAYSVVLGRTRFGFDLRATGRSESAAVASGVSVKRMVLLSMLLSGAVAGLVGMPQLLGASYTYSIDFPAGLGFTGIAIALLGRNNAVGMALSAVLFAFLDASSVILDINDISKEIVLIMQGTIVLSVVVAYELVRRYSIAAEQRRVSRELASQGSPEREEVAT
ncbi:MAG: ral nucleoside transport system permease protein [Actinomycetota bacterium]|jgi:simple sugar transport system permease protein|nr:ral nucleoside transport system permease protein [Actinomycetota bacterium]MDQ1666083.1 ral nucleoside transport system permease protein [Actinomycetota bacterium]MDQ1670903.1 ral nucleoside transport system permease protein [Actinomycetota bacterium]